eukprot:CAMPEP_0181096454 /NCGR_PEP_ID=MMETSP1071-20121207/11042_1 /TAXON_ID=35127 /ORGANISM="Thalassiosira sp., Strain NH16" /LENGTH=198 /DNA_ID=CAMNT_0023178865 /DNA_START=122 /DNA_END=718 /DNA_ORIENTATION=+
MNSHELAYLMRRLSNESATGSSFSSSNGNIVPPSPPEILSGAYYCSSHDASLSSACSGYNSSQDYYDDASSSTQDFELEFDGGMPASRAPSFHYNSMAASFCDGSIMAVGTTVSQHYSTTSGGSSSLASSLASSHRNGMSRSRCVHRNLSSMGYGSDSSESSSDDGTIGRHSRVPSTYGSSPRGNEGWGYFVDTPKRT